MRGRLHELFSSLSNYYDSHHNKITHSKQWKRPTPSRNTSIHMWGKNIGVMPPSMLMNYGRLMPAFKKPMTWAKCGNNFSSSAKQILVNVGRTNIRIMRRYLKDSNSWVELPVPQSQVDYVAHFNAVDNNDKDSSGFSTTIKHTCYYIRIFCWRCWTELSILFTSLS